LGHIENNHYASKKIKALDAKKTNSLNNLLSIGLAVISGDPGIGIASSLAINRKLLNNLSYNSIKFEIQADDFMINKIKERNLNTKGLINFIEELPDNQNVYFATHPRNEDRINILKNLARKDSVINSPEFNWIKAKYGKNSQIDDFNEFFINLEKGIISQIEKKSVPNSYFNYEMYKKGISQLNNAEIFQELYSINNNSFLKIEYFNYIIDNQLTDIYELIEKNKENKAMQEEYYFHYIYGKYYAKRNDLNLSNFYFCQFFKTTNQSQKIDYYCNNYDKNKISNLDNSYALSN
jgi:predicted Zn-dependent protease